MKISKETSAMLRDWNLENYGRGVSMNANSEINDPEVIARLEQLRWSNETIDDVIQRVIRQGGGGQAN
jgi:hypothetical protein